MHFAGLAYLHTKHLRVNCKNLEKEQENNFHEGFDVGKQRWEKIVDFFNEKRNQSELTGLAFQARRLPF